MLNAYQTNTLDFDSSRCNNCIYCIAVCPHAVFVRHNNVVSLQHPERCMECGACQLNCPTGAIQVESGVGCATAMMMSSIKGQKECTCG